MREKEKSSGGQPCMLTCVRKWRRVASCGPVLALCCSPIGGGAGPSPTGLIRAGRASCLCVAGGQGAFFIFIFKKIKIAKIYYGIKYFQKYTPTASPPTGRGPTVSPSSGRDLHVRKT